MSSLFAITDIETTGGNAKNAGITEICVCITDGYKVIQEYETLLNTGYNIPSDITALTGITTEMCENAPVFESIASELYHLLHDKIFVAHNVNFDYSFLFEAFKRAGFRFLPPRICSVKLSRKAFPGYRSYGLGNICKSLDIEIEHRHRAGGDARATAKLFHLCVNEMGLESVLKFGGNKRLKVNLPAGVSYETIEQLPNTPGIYYFLNSTGKPLYIGKARQLQKRVMQHFEPKTGKLRLDLDKIVNIDFEESGSETLALLMESEAIMKHWPEWNKAAKNPYRQYAIHCYPTAGGSLRIQTEKRGSANAAHNSFSRLSDARASMFKLIADFEICTGLAHSNINCAVPECYCKWEEPKRTKEHNKRIQKAMDKYHAAAGAELVLVGRGRSEGEKALIGVRQGCVYGWGFALEDTTENDPGHFIKEVKENPELRKLSNSLLKKIEAGLSQEFKIWVAPEAEPAKTKKVKV